MNSTLPKSKIYTALGIVAILAILLLAITFFSKNLAFSRLAQDFATTQTAAVVGPPPMPQCSFYRLESTPDDEVEKAKNCRADKFVDSGNTHYISQAWDYSGHQCVRVADYTVKNENGVLISKEPYLCGRLYGTLETFYQDGSSNARIQYRSKDYTENSHSLNATRWGLAVYYFDPTIFGERYKNVVSKVEKYFDDVIDGVEVEWTACPAKKFYCLDDHEEMTHMVWWWRGVKHGVEQDIVFRPHEFSEEDLKMLPSKWSSNNASLVSGYLEKVTNHITEYKFGLKSGNEETRAYLAFPVSEWIIANPSNPQPIYDEYIRESFPWRIVKRTNGDESVLDGVEYHFTAIGNAPNRSFFPTEELYWNMGDLTCRIRYNNDFSIQSMDPIGCASDGVKTIYYPSQNNVGVAFLAQTARVKKSETTWKDGMLNGTMKTWYPSGKAHTQETYVDNKLNGIQVQAYENGVIAHVVLRYVNGEKQGIEQERYSNNKPRYQVYWEKDQKNKTETVWDEDGKVTWQKCWDKGTEISCSR